MIDKEKLYGCVSRYFGSISQSTNGWYTVNCPICGKKDKLAIHFDYMIAKCWVGCYRGYLVDLIQNFHGLTHFETLELIDSMEPGLGKIPNNIVKAKELDMMLPRGYTPILSGNTVMGERARNYLKNRGFDLNVMDRIGIGYCIDTDPDPEMNFFGRIIIPFKKRGVLSYYIGRTFIDDYLRYKNPPRTKFGIGKADIIFNEEAFQLEDLVFVTEGWACAASLGKNGASIQGSVPSTIQKNIMLKSDVKELVFMPDAGYYLNGLQASRDFLNVKKVKVLNLTSFQEKGKGKDVNEIGVKNILELYNNTQYTDIGYLFREMRRIT